MEETILLNLEVDQGQAEKDLIAVNKAILNNKEAAQELTKAYKAGTITQEEYVEENIRLQQNLKKNQQLSQSLTKVINTESGSRNDLRNKISRLVNEYDNLNTTTKKGEDRAKQLQKELSRLNSELTKSDKAAGLFKNQIGNYPEAFKNAASGINVAGVSLGDVSTKLAGFINPATAAIGIVTALGAAYARSTIGAKDLSFASNQLSAVTTILTNKFAGLISSAEDGEGAFTKLLNLSGSFISSLAGPLGVFLQGPIDDLLAKSKEIALAQERLDDLAREEIDVRGKIADRLEENQDFLTEINDSQTSLNRQAELAQKIEDNLVQNKLEILDILQKQSAEVAIQLAGDKENEVLQQKAKQLAADINKESAALNKRIANNDKLQSNINDKLREELILRQGIAAADARLANKSKGILGVPDLSDPKKNLTDADKTKAQLDDQKRTQDIIEGTAKFELDSAKNLNKGLEELERQRVQRSIEQKEQEVKNRITLDNAYLNAAGSVFNSLSQLAKDGSAEQKELALAGIAVDTAAAIAGGVSSSQDIPYPGNLVATATTIATILANIAQAKSIIDSGGFAAGGWTGPGEKNDVAGVVHADEYVTPKRVVHMPAAQPHLNALESMRTRGYADGGFVTGRSTSEANAALITANALRNLPPFEISAVEMTRVQKRVAVKEKLSTL